MHDRGGKSRAPCIFGVGGFTRHDMAGVYCTFGGEKLISALVRGLAAIVSLSLFSGGWATYDILCSGFLSRVMLARRGAAGCCAFSVLACLLHIVFGEESGKGCLGGWPVVQTSGGGRWGVEGVRRRMEAERRQGEVWSLRSGWERRGRTGDRAAGDGWMEGTVCVCEEGV
jgi:hypothetical protein